MLVSVCVWLFVEGKVCFQSVVFGLPDGLHKLKKAHPTSCVETSSQKCPLFFRIISHCIFCLPPFSKYYMENTNAKEPQQLNKCLVLPGTEGSALTEMGGIKTFGSLAREQRFCVGKNSWDHFISYVNQLIIDVLETWKLFLCSHASIYCLGGEGEGKLQGVCFASSMVNFPWYCFTSLQSWLQKERMGYLDLMSHQRDRVVSVSESLPIAEWCAIPSAS